MVKKYVRIQRSFHVINVCNQGKTLCSPCVFSFWWFFLGISILLVLHWHSMFPFALLSTISYGYSVRYLGSIQLGLLMSELHILHSNLGRELRSSALLHSEHWQF